MLPIIQVSKTKMERRSMPQIDDVIAFVNFCRSQGFHYHKITISPDRLTPRQNEINLGIVFQIIDKGLNTDEYPLLISKDLDICDGHHRWYAGKVQITEVVCYQVAASEYIMLKLAELFGAKHRRINAKEKKTFSPGKSIYFLKLL